MAPRREKLKYKMHLNPATWMERTDCGPVPHETELARSDTMNFRSIRRNIHTVQFKGKYTAATGGKIFTPEAIVASPIVVIKQYDYLYTPLSIRNEFDDFAATFTVFVVAAAIPTRPYNPHVVADFVRTGSMSIL